MIIIMDFEKCDDYKKLLTDNRDSIIRHSKCSTCGNPMDKNNNIGDLVLGDLVEAVDTLRTSNTKTFYKPKPKSIVQKIGSWFKC